MKMKRNLYPFALMLLAPAVFAQEIISDLPCNPHLYYKYKSLAGFSGWRTGGSSSFFFVPDTLPLPFVDDFSVYHLKSYQSPENFSVAFRINRNIELTDTIRQFAFVHTSTHTYIFDTASHAVDTVENRIQLILNNNAANRLIITDTVAGWAPFNVFDTLGNAPDTLFLTPDSIIAYSVFYAVKDPDARWLDHYVYVNDVYPVNKLSYGVATFDGLNEFGLPYNNTPNAYGGADTLTSMPINLSGLAATDSVVLSFVYQPQGLGNKPEPEDSLVLEFRNIGSAIPRWDIIWSAPGFSDTAFKYVAIEIQNPTYLDPAFQFRFRNKATISGNNDHWHIDYVHLGKKRTADAVIKDVCVLNPATSFLKNYRSMPWNHFAGFEDSETQDGKMTFRNNRITDGLLRDIHYRADEVYSNDVIFSLPVFVFDMKPDRSPPLDSAVQEFPYAVNNFIPYAPRITTDSVLIDVKTSFNEGNPDPLTRENDVVSSPVLFKNYFAYDDGTAEKAYGLEPQGLLKFAYEFRLNKSDTLRAIQIHFAQINQNLSLFEFTLTVWRSINLDGSGREDTLYFRQRMPISYLPGRNGFAVYRIDPPLFLNTAELIDNKFYVGWQQLFSENMQIGLDLNNSAKEHMFFYSDGEWKRSMVDGAVMIRPVVGKPLPLTATEADASDVLEEVSLYPNPAGDFIFLHLPRFVRRVDVYDMQGRLVKSFPGSLQRMDISDLRSGLYGVHVSGKNHACVKKFIKR